jgi:hypothetical protein
MNRKHEHWQSIREQRLAMGFLKKKNPLLKKLENHSVWAETLETMIGLLNRILSFKRTSIQTGA